MIAVHDLDHDEKDFDESGTSTTIPLSSKHISDEGIYLLENGEDCLIYVNNSVPQNILQQLFGLLSVEEIQISCRNSNSSVKFHSELLNYIKIECQDIHGNQKQQKRISTFFGFCKAEKGILLCTDVAARGLDIPSVKLMVWDWDQNNETRGALFYMNKDEKTLGRRDPTVGVDSIEPLWLHLLQSNACRC